ncbi:MAG TPA: hypothetical protein VFF73_09860 [Planctomycetota bacterium]|nr:hypothetical protein [Planctomycetota bacterium]
MRRRLLAAILIIVTNLFALAWVDDRILLRDPVELNTRLRLILKKLFPEQDPYIDHIDVDVSNRRVSAYGLDFKDKEKKPLFSIERVDATLSLTDWLAPREVFIRGVKAHVRLKGEHLNFEDLALGGSGPTGGRPGALAVTVEDARLDFEDENTGARSLLVCERAELAVQADGRVTGTGHAHAGALVPSLSPLAPGGAPVENDPEVLYREIIQKIDFDIDRRADGRTAIPIYVEHVAVGPLLRSLLPRYVQDVIWSELNPEGTVDAGATVTLGTKSATPHISIDVNAKNCSLRLKKFPYPIRDIEGRFEIAVGALPIISWEDVKARLDGDGRVAHARGSFFLGHEDENVSLYVFIDARDVPLDETLRNAMPADIRGVYDQFDVKGVCGPAKVIIFKGPFMDDPQLSIRADLDGRQSAAFRDHPVRFTAKKGTFALREGGNVEIAADGALEVGGSAHVDAHVIHGDLMHVRIKTEHVPVSDQLIGLLDAPVRRMIVPFAPRGGEVAGDVLVEKSDPTKEPLPRAAVVLSGVSVAPSVFPYDMKVDGLVDVTPRPGVGVSVGLALTANAPAIEAAVVSGSVFLDPEKDGAFTGDLAIHAARVHAHKDLVDALPRGLGSIVKRIAPEGALRNVEAHVRSLESFDARGEGDGLTTALDSFPYRAEVARFDLGREDRRVALRAVEGRAKGGTWNLAGTIELPPEATGGDPVLDVTVGAKAVPLDAPLLAALPGDARRSLERLKPSGGKLDATLRVAIAPALPLDLTGDIAIAGTKLFLDGLDASLEGTASVPVDDVKAHLRLDGERAWIDTLEGRFKGAPVSAGGSVAMARPPMHGDGVAPETSRTLLDIVAHVDGLALDEATRKLARGSIESALHRFPVEGRCDLDCEVKTREGQDPTVFVRVRPLGASVVPQILPFDFEDVRGAIDVRGGEPEVVELTARLGQARVVVRRDRRNEAFVTPGTSVFTVKATGVRPDELARAPEDFTKMVKDFAIKGSVDLEVSVAIPPEERGKQRFLAELKTQDFTVTSGLKFESCKGVLRVAGSVSKIDPIELDGTLDLEHAEWKHQVFQDARIPVHMRDGQLSFGTAREPFAGTLYGGQLRGRVQTNLKDAKVGELPGHAYTGALYLSKGQLSIAADQLSKLGEEPKQTGPKSSGGQDPVRGELTVRLDFQGGGTSPDGHPIGLSGDAVILATNANFIRVPLLFGTMVDIVKGVARGDSSYDAKAFDRLYTRLKLKPSHVDIDLIQLASDTLTLRGIKGRLDWDGGIDLDLLPFKTGAVFEDLFKQFAGVTVRGTVQHPETHEMPFYNGIDRLLRAIKDAFSSTNTERVGETTPPAKQP